MSTHYQPRTDRTACGSKSLDRTIRAERVTCPRCRAALNPPTVEQWARITEAADAYRAVAELAGLGPAVAAANEVLAAVLDAT